MIDPWPAHSGNTNIAANGQRMQSAVERYRTNKVILPVDPMTGTATNPQPATPIDSARREPEQRPSYANHRAGDNHDDDDGRHRGAVAGAVPIMSASAMRV